MKIQQPIWKKVGTIGDNDPFSYSGGFVYVDETGVYPPEIQWFEPGTDEQWKELDDLTPLTTYRILIENNPENEWFFDELPIISRYAGLPIEELTQMLNGSVMEKASVYMDLIHYFGAEEFDQYPNTMTEREARERFKD